MLYMDSVLTYLQSLGIDMQIVRCAFWKKLMKKIAESIAARFSPIASFASNAVCFRKSILFCPV